MGALDYLSLFCSITQGSKSRHKALQTVEIKVKMDCDGCERKVRQAIKNMTGVESIEVNRKIHKVKVRGYIDPKKVLNKVKSTGKKKAEFWPYIEQHLVSYPYASQVYDKSAPSGFVKNVTQASALTQDQPDEKFTFLFSDDNTHACTIM